MIKEDVLKLYTMDDLIPIVRELAEKLTSGESSSVTYEKARQLMEAVIYCIAHFDNGAHSLSAASTVSAMDAYHIGYTAVTEKVKRTYEKYIKLMSFFDHYGNLNYMDTIEKALPCFFLYYNARFAPTSNIITLDYPVFGLDMNLEGIDMIAQYIEAVCKEQEYLCRFPRAYVIDLLRSFHPRYEYEFFNIKEIVGQR